MDRFTRCLCVVVAACLALSCRVGRAEILGPATYHGYFARDRWGRNVFHLGPYHLFVSDDVAKTLAEHAGKPLEVEVTRMSQPRNPGAGMIMSVGRVAVKGAASGLVLSARLNAPKVVEGEGVEFQLSVRNRSSAEITVDPRAFTVVLVTDTPFANSAIGYKDPEDRAYWYHRYTYGRIEFGGPRKPLRVACREFRLGWKAQDLISRGKGITLAKGIRGRNGWTTFAPGAVLEVKHSIGTELLPDDYEAFFYGATGNLSHTPGPMSSRVSFDVIPREK